MAALSLLEAVSLCCLVMCTLHASPLGFPERLGCHIRLLLSATQICQSAAISFHINCVSIYRKHVWITLPNLPTDSGFNSIFWPGIRMRAPVNGYTFCLLSWHADIFLICPEEFQHACQLNAHLCLLACIMCINTYFDSSLTILISI